MTDPAIAARSDALSRALAKLPPFDGVVYRNGDFAAEVTARYVAGQVLREDAFTSASVHGGGSGSVRYEIVSTTGKDTSPFSAAPDEGEIVFDRGTCFFVLGVELVDGRTHVLLADLTAPGAQLDVAAAAERIRAQRPRADAAPGLADGKGFFPVGIRPDGSANVVATLRGPSDEPPAFMG